MRWERFVIVTVMLFSLSTPTGINEFHPILVPREWRLSFSHEGLWSELEELHSADAPTASRKPERGKRSFIDPNVCVHMCTPCAEPAQNDKLDLTRSVTTTYLPSRGDEKGLCSACLSVFPHFVMQNHTDDC